MGGVHHNSTDSESEVDASFRYLNKKEVSRKTEEGKQESVYWADCEKDKKDLDSYDSELEPADRWKCLKCGTPNKPYIRYCGKCWRERKGWVSSYQRKKKRTETDSAEREGEEDSLCLFCVTRKKNACLVHGRIGHQVLRS